LVISRAVGFSIHVVGLCFDQIKTIVIKRISVDGAMESGSE